MFEGRTGFLTGNLVLDLSILAWFRSMILDRLSITTMAASPSALISCKKYLQSMSSIRHFSAASIWE